MRTVITMGTYDLFHRGHLNLLKRAAAMGDRLIVGVSSDALNFEKKGRLPIYNELDRVEIIRNLKCVDTVFIEMGLEWKADYIRVWQADCLVMGDDWRGKFDYLREEPDLENLDIIYLPRTPGISTTELLHKIKNIHQNGETEI